MTNSRRWVGIAIALGYVGIGGCRAAPAQEVHTSASRGAGGVSPAGAAHGGLGAPGDGAVAQHGSEAPRDSAAAHQRSRAPGDSAEAHVVLAHALPKLVGSQLAATLVEVSYGPGGASPPHSHPCPVVGYVIEGALRSQVGGQRESIYTAGQSFYEPPNSAHLVSANASRERPVRFLAFFTCDRKASLTTPLPAGAAAGRH
jgi:quercetin dioxygenase-like cupin family protein